MGHDSFQEPPQKTQPGFLAHVRGTDDGTFVIRELEGNLWTVVHFGEEEVL
jgi:hypothetical protein